MHLKYFEQPRLHLYGALLLFAIIEMSLTAARISHTGFYYRSYEGSVAGLLTISLLTLIWVPYAAWTQLGKNKLIQRRESQYAEGSFQHQSIGNIILWFLWLVCTAVIAAKCPSTRFCVAKDQCSLLIAIQAIGWMEFTFFTVINVLLLVHMMVFVDRLSIGRQPTPTRST